MAMDALTWVASMLRAVALAHWESSLDWYAHIGALERNL